MAVMELRSFSVAIASILRAELHRQPEELAESVHQLSYAIEGADVGDGAGQSPISTAVHSAHFRRAFSAMMRVLEARAGMRRWTGRIRRMMTETYPDGDALIWGLVFRPLHESIVRTTKVLTEEREPFLISRRARIMAHIERGAPPAPRTVAQWVKFGRSLAHSIHDRVVEREGLRCLDDSNNSAPPSATSLTDCFAACNLIGDLSRAHLVFAPASFPWED